MTAVVLTVGAVRSPQPVVAPPELDRPGAAGPPRPQLWQVGVLAALAALLLVSDLRHQPWFDEAQAWLIARDDSVWDILIGRTHYEGAPPLWQLLLVPEAKLRLPYRTLELVSGLATLAGAWIVVRRAPFPVWLRAAIPFTYFIAFQYGVVARSYCLVAPLLFLAAAAHPWRRARPWRWSLPLAALALVSVHGTVVAACLEAWRLAEIRREWADLDPAGRRRRLLPAAVVAAAVALACLMVLPNGDETGSGGWRLGWSAVAALAQQAPDGVLGWIAELAVVAALPWMARRGLLSMLVAPGAILVAFYAARYYSPWHAGVLVELWIAVLWMGWARAPRRLPALARADRFVPALLATVVGVHLVWTAVAVRDDLGTPYSGAGALADYIRANHLEGRVDAEGKWIISLFPYFDGMVVADYNGGALPAFYPWSRRHDPLLADDTVLRRDAEAIVVVVATRTTEEVPCLPGYRLDAVFPGDVRVAGRSIVSETFVVFRRAPGARGVGNCLAVSR